MLSIVEELRTNRESGARRLEAEYKAGLMTIARKRALLDGFTHRKKPLPLAQPPIDRK